MNVPKYSCPICHRKNWQIRLHLHKNAIDIICSKCDYEGIIYILTSEPTIRRKEVIP